jgi:hypothetical protein
MLRNVFQSIEAMDAQQISRNLAEKRRALRVKSYAQVQLTCEGQGYRGTVTELGVEGLRLKSLEAPLSQGQSLEVLYELPEEVEERGSVRVEVAWVQRVGREMVAGARYVDSRENMRKSWVRLLLQEIGFDDSRTYQKRQHLRVDTTIPARMFQHDQLLGGEHRVVNLGIGGALLHSSLPLERGGIYSLEMSLWRILPTLRLPVGVIEVRPDTAEGHLISLQFGEMDPPQVKVLGNYIINMINQTA